MLLHGVRARDLHGLSPVVRQALALAALSRASESCCLLRMKALFVKPGTSQPSVPRQAMLHGKQETALAASTATTLG